MPPPGPPPPGPPAAPPMAPAPPMPPAPPMAPAGPPVGVPNPPPPPAPNNPPMAPVAPHMPPNVNNQFPPTSMGYPSANPAPFPPISTSTPSHPAQHSPPAPPMPPQQQQQQFPPPPPANFPPPPDAYFAPGQMHNRPLPPVPDHQYDIMVSPAMSVSPSQASLSSHQSTESSRSISPPVGPRSSPGQNRLPLTSLQEESAPTSLQAALVNKLQLRQRSRSIEDQQPPNIKSASLQRGVAPPSMVHQMTMPAAGVPMMGNAPPVAHKPPRHGNRSITRSNTLAGPPSAVGKYFQVYVH